MESKSVMRKGYHCNIKDLDFQEFDRTSSDQILVLKFQATCYGEKGFVPIPSDSNCILSDASGRDFILLNHKLSSSSAKKKKGILQFIVPRSTIAPFSFQYSRKWKKCKVMIEGTKFTSDSGSAGYRSQSSRSSFTTSPKLPLYVSPEYDDNKFSQLAESSKFVTLADIPKDSTGTPFCFPESVSSYSRSNSVVSRQSRSDSLFRSKSNTNLLNVNRQYNEAKLFKVNEHQDFQRRGTYY